MADDAATELLLARSCCTPSVPLEVASKPPLERFEPRSLVLAAVADAPYYSAAATCATAGDSCAGAIVTNNDAAASTTTFSSAAAATAGAGGASNTAA